MSLIKAKIRGSAILEVVIGFFLITLSVSLTAILVSNVLQSSNRAMRQKAALAVRELVQEHKMNRTFPDEHIEYPEFIVVVSVDPVEQTPALLHVRYQAMSPSNSLLYMRQFYIEPIKPEPNER